MTIVQEVRDFTQRRKFCARMSIYSDDLIWVVFRIRKSVEHFDESMDSTSL